MSTEDLLRLMGTLTGTRWAIFRLFNVVAIRYRRDKTSLAAQKSYPANVALGSVSAAARRRIGLLIRPLVPEIC